MARRYFWLKLKNTYFNQLTQKKMRRQPNGKEMQIIYLRMLLSSLDKEGYIHYQGVYDSIEEELSEEFDEPQEIVKQTIDFLIDNNMVTVDSKSSLFMPEAMENVGSISDSGVRMQNMRDKKKTSQCDESVTSSDGGVTQRREEQRRTETEQEKEKETDTETGDFPPGNEVSNAENRDFSWSNRDFPSGNTNYQEQNADLFSARQLLDIAEKNKVNLSWEGVKVFHEEMHETGWQLYGRQVEKTGIVKALRGWAKYHPEYGRRMRTSATQQISGNVSAEECGESEEWNLPFE